MSNAAWMIYGANGYTGELCAREAVRRGWTPVLAGRNAQAITALGAELGLETCVVALSDASDLERALADMSAVLHCAGPFSATARPMLDACANTGTHYLDITGEVDVFEYSQANDARWKAAGIVAMPGAGCDVVPTDCLAAMLKRALPDATHLTLALVSEPMQVSPGTAKTVVEGLPNGALIRRDGELVSIPSGSKTRVVPFDHGKKVGVCIPWGDVSTAYWSTAIPNIEVYLGSSEKEINQMRTMGKLGWLLGLGPVQSFLKRQVAKRVPGATEAERAATTSHFWGEVTNAEGHTASITLTGPDAYDLTVDAALHATVKVAEGTIAPGAHTPSTAFGPDFVLTLNGVSLGETVPTEAST